MKLSELRQLIKEEIQSIREADAMIKNPDTGRNIKVKSALTYPKDTAVYKAAAKAKPGAAKAMAQKSKNVAPKQTSSKAANTPNVVNKNHQPQLTPVMFRPGIYKNSNPVNDYINHTSHYDIKDHLAAAKYHLAKSYEPGNKNSAKHFTTARYHSAKIGVTPNNMTAMDKINNINDLNKYLKS